MPLRPLVPGYPVEQFLLKLSRKEQETTIRHCVAGHYVVSRNDQTVARGELTSDRRITGRHIESELFRSNLRRECFCVGSEALGINIDRR